MIKNAKTYEVGVFFVGADMGMRVLVCVRARVYVCV
jgi:hypothetical protein